MSSFIVDDSIINTIVAGLMHASGYPDEPRPSGLLHPSKLGMEAAAALGCDLLDMNVDAFTYRYEGRHQEEPAVFVYQANGKPDVFQFSKSIRCLLYQCSEGNIPDMDLYKELDNYSSLLAHHIVSKQPAYNAATWG